jgi:hypothetical protein
MRLLDIIRTISVKAASRLATQRRMSHFKCGDCEEAEHCGRLPSNNCIERAVQIERDGDKSRSSSLRDYEATY